MPIQPFKKSQDCLFQSPRQKKKRKSKPKLRQKVRTVDIEKVYIKGDSTDYRYKLNRNTEVIHDTIHSYRINSLRYTRKITGTY